MVLEKEMMTELMGGFTLDMNQLKARTLLVTLGF
jgi:hypothetical protein